MRRSDKFDLVESNVRCFVELRNKLNAGLSKICLSFCETYVNADEKDDFIKKWNGVVDQVDIQNYISTEGELQDIEDGNSLTDTTCKDCFRRVGIRSNGDVQCCCSSFISRDVIIDNLNESPMYDIWYGEKMKRIQKVFLYEIDKIPAYCKKCISNRWEF